MWTAGKLTDENRSYLATFPKARDSSRISTFFTGRPQDEDEYLVEPSDVEGIVPERTLSFFGHTHLQGGFLMHRQGVRPITTPTMFVDETAAYLINPGSVGQPRDGDPRAGYALYNSSTRVVEYHRTDYDIQQAARKIFDAGLPELLGMRSVSRSLAFLEESDLLFCSGLGSFCSSRPYPNHAQHLNGDQRLPGYPKPLCGFRRNEVKTQWLNMQ